MPWKCEANTPTIKIGEQGFAPTPKPDVIFFYKPRSVSLQNGVNAVARGVWLSSIPLMRKGLTH
jgi:hypothetical protein